jgi:probable rRNA maturation factor
MLQPLTLSLQFGSLAKPLPHRTALPRHKVARWIRHALLQSPGEITVRIVDTDEGRALNRDYRKKDYATNVLTFDYAQSPVVTADIILCAPVIAQEAAAQGKTLQAHYAHLVVHGVLHAQGWDHETSHADALAMEALEVKILAGLGLESPY